MSQSLTPRGFTLIEILMVLAILGILLTFTASTFMSMHQASALRIARGEVYIALRDARNNTLASQGDTVFGVRVSTSSVTRFRGTTYDSSTSTNEVYVFEAGVTATGTLVELGTDIVFARLSGRPSVSGTIELLNRDGSASSTVVIYPSGLID